MKLLAAITILLLVSIRCPAEESAAQGGAKLTRFEALSGSKVTLKGEYSVHDWKAEGTLIGGFLEVEPSFPTLPSADGKAARLSARGEVFIPVRNLRAVGESREEYTEQMTGIIHRLLHADDHPRIYFWLLQLETGVRQPGEGLPMFVATGKLGIAGVTNQISLPISVKRLESGAIQISGKTTVKQSDFRIIPKPTGFRCFAADPDPVEVAFDWVVKEAGRR